MNFNLFQTIGKLRSRFRQIQVNARVALGFRHLAGPRRVKLNSEELLVVCLVKNGGIFLRPFIEHHQRLGAAHLLFIDNGSTDGTVEIARTYSDVSIIGNQLPVKNFECLIRSQAIKRFAGQAWCLVVDIDELFDYPGSATMSVAQLLRYLNSNSYNAVVAQMLDLFPNDQIEVGGKYSPGDFVAVNRLYDLSSIEKVNYHNTERIEFSALLKNNSIPSVDINFYYGGIRRAMFGTNNCLTKHPLLRLTQGLIPITHPHCSSNARCADFSVLLAHYKFAGDFHSRIRGEVEGKVWNHGENNTILRSIESSDAPRVKVDSAREFSGVDALVVEGFLVTSDVYQRWVISQC